MNKYGFCYSGIEKRDPMLLLGHIAAKKVQLYCLEPGTNKVALLSGALNAFEAMDHMAQVFS